MGLANVLDIARRTLSASQQMLQITSNNIANVNTPGYTRQVGVVEETQPIQSAGTLLGTGVTVTDVRRAFDQLNNTQFNTALANKGLAEGKNNLLRRIESLVNESVSSGLSQTLTDFFNAFEDLAADPTNMGARGNVQQQGVRLATQVTTIYDALTEIQKDANSAAGTMVTQINQLAGQLAQLNGDILAQEVNGQAPTLRDQRDRLVKDLAKLMNVTTFQDSTGNVNVLVGNGRSLVAGTTANSLTHSDRVAGNLVVQDLNLTNSTGATILVTKEITAGELGANLAVRDTLVDDSKNKLNELTSALVSEVNGQHVLGFGLTGTTGVDFFEPLTPINQALSERSGVSIIGSAGASNANATGAGIIAGRVSNRTALTGESYETRFGFVVASGVNDTLRVVEGGSSSAADTVTLTANLNGQTGFALASDLQTQLNSSATLNGAYSVSYDSTAGTFTITETGGGITVTLDNAVGTADETLGFTSNPTAASSVVSDTARVDDALYTIINTTDVPDTVVGTANQAYVSGGTIAFEGISTVISSNANTFAIVSGANDRLVFDAGSGPVTLTLTAGLYSGDELAAELKDRLEASNGNADTYAVSYNGTTKRFSIANASTSSNTLTLNFGNASSTAAQMLGFDTDGNATVAVSAFIASDTATGGPQAGDIYRIQAVRDAAANLAVSSSILTDLNTLAIAGRANAIGDNSNALAIGALQTSAVTNDARSTLNEFYGSLVGEIGSTLNGVQKDQTFQSGIVEQLENRRSQAAGVSLDEEFISLIKYERSFQAAARIIALFDDLTQQLVNI